MRAWGLAAATVVLLSIPTPIARSQQVGDDPLVDVDTGRALLAMRVETLLAERAVLLAGAKVGISVRDLKSGQTVYERNPTALFNTASNAKLFTTAAALALLGPDFTFQTSVFGARVDDKGTIPGNIYLRGRGDPVLGIADLRALARDLWMLGVRKVRGGVIVDTSYFDGADTPPHFSDRPDDAAAYRAPIGAAAIGFNSYVLQIAPPRIPGGLPLVAIDPPQAYIDLQAQIEMIETGRTRLRVESKLRAGKLWLKVTGQMRADEGEKRYRRRIPSSLLFAGALFRKALAQEGIQVGHREVKAGKVPPRASWLAVHNSLPLAELVRGMGKYSNNFVAEMILKTIGAEMKEDREAPATWDDGLGAVRRYLAEEVGLEPGTFTYDNGSGLFASNQFSPRQIVRLLVFAYDDFRIGPDFVASLSIGGADGTLRSRMQQTRAERQLRAKTGTLEQVSALSGYAALNSRAPLAFSILVNGFPPDNADAARSLQDDLGDALLGYLEMTGR